MGRDVAIYTRLSVNEGGERDGSLETQGDLLRGYVEEHGLGSYRLYVDSDISGTYFDRPGLLRLVGDINANRIGVVVVKDLSRLGRNNGETLTFLDFLRERDVRLISLGDNYDSFRDDDEIIGIRTWVNEHYARDISRKVKYNLKKKMQRGEFLGRPPFGYLKSGVERNRLVVDERYREVIKEIFDLYIKGWGYRSLAAHVQSLEVPTPSRDKNYNRPQARRWNELHIRRILANRVYCGDTVQGVSEKVSFKSRKTRRVESQRWIVTPGTHEAIIDRETFALAQGARARRRLKGRSGRKGAAAAPHLFTGFVVCAGCGAHHVFRQNKNRPPGYICGGYNKLGRKGCAAHHIAEESLVRRIVRDIRTLAQNVPFGEGLLDELRKDNGSRDLLQMDVKRIEAEIAGRKRRLQTVYLDRVRGVISEELFMETRGMLEREIDLLAGRRRGLSCELESINRFEREIGGLASMPVEPGAGDIDRVFLEKYVREIIVLAPGEEISQGVIDKCELGEVLGGDLPGEVEDGGTRLIIIYNLTPF